MSKDKLIPELRFPEFMNEGEWELTTIGKLGSFYYGKSAPKWSLAEDAPTLCVRYGELYTKFDTIISEIKSRTNIAPVDLKFSKGGEILVPRVGERATDFAKNCCYLPFSNIAIGEMISVFETKEFPIFYTHYFRTLWREFAEVVEGQNVKNLYYINLEPIKIGKPSYSEQQKIASCLSSLDEVIAANSHKLELLKDHKKGLMQNLFPQEGEKVPKYRFKEFEKDGEWVEKSIQKLIDKKSIVSHLDGNHGALYPKAEEFSKEGIPYITANDFISGLINFSKCKFLPVIKAKQFKKGVAKNGDILFAHNATVGPVAKLVTSFPYVILSTTATYFRCDNENLINDFLLYALTSPSFVKQYTRVMSQSTRNQVPITTQREFILHLPKPIEQQKIASCLSSLDALIIAQKEKIEQLKMHKKGLMQGLFPKINE